MISAAYVLALMATGILITLIMIIIFFATIGFPAVILCFMVLAAIELFRNIDIKKDIAYFAARFQYLDRSNSKEENKKIFEEMMLDKRIRKTLFLILRLVAYFILLKIVMLMLAFKGIYPQFVLPYLAISFFLIFYNAIISFIKRKKLKGTAKAKRTEEEIYKGMKSAKLWKKAVSKILEAAELTILMLAFLHLTGIFTL